MLSDSLTIIIGLLFLIICVAVTMKYDINMGVLAMCAVVILGILLRGMSLGQILAFFPTRFVILVITTSIFFGFFVMTGAAEKACEWLIYALRGRGWALPLMVFFVALLVSGTGSGAQGPLVFMAVAGFSLQKKSGFNPLLVPAGVVLGGAGGSFFPWVTDGAVFSSYVAEAFGAEEAADIMNVVGPSAVILSTAVFLLLYVILRGWKGATVEAVKPESLSAHQKLALGLVLGTIALCVLPSLIYSIAPNPVCLWMKGKIDIVVCASIGAVILTVVKAADLNEILVHRVPWKMIYMVITMQLLIDIIAAAGVVDYIAAFFSENVPVFLIPALIAAICGALSFFADFVVIFPLFMPLAATLIATTNVHPVAIMVAIMVPPAMGAVCPFSTGGAVSLAQCTDKELASQMVSKQFLLAIVVCILTGLLFLTPIGHGIVFNNW